MDAREHDRAVSGDVAVESEFLGGLRYVTIGITVAVGLFVFAAIVWGNIVTQLAAGACAVALLHGWWRGGLQTGVVVLSVVLAAAVAASIGRAIETSVGNAFHIGGLAGRIVSVAMVFAVVAGVGLLVGGVLARRLVRTFPRLQVADKMLGVTVGLFEGGVFSIALVCVPLMLVPIAETQLQQQRDSAAVARLKGQDPPAEHLVAKGIVHFARMAQESVVGDIAVPLNPLQETRAFSLVSLVSEATRDPEAMERFIQSPTALRVCEMPEILHAIELFEAQPELLRNVETEGLTGSTLLRLVNSDEVLRILDETGVVGAMTKMLPEIEQALRDALHKDATVRE